MYVNDLEKAKEFFEKYFGAVANKKYYNKTKGFSSYFLSFDEGARLEIMNIPSLNKADTSPNRIGYIHIALSVGSREKVDSITKMLKTDGFTVLSEPRITGDGYYESSVAGFEGNIIEITI